MRLATLLKIVAGLVVLVIAVVFVALVVIDPNEYKDEIITAVEDRTGRKFSIDSDIELDIGLAPAIAIGGVRLANAEWGSRPDMMRAGEFAAEVALLPLIFGNLQINRLVLRDADLLIETDAQGRSNLAFAATKTAKEPSEGGISLPQIKDVLIEDAVVTLIDGAQGTTNRFEIRRLTAKAENLSAPLAIELEAIAAVEGEELDVRAEGEIGGPRLFFDLRRPYPVDVTIAVLGIDLKIAGAVAAPADVQGLDLKIEISASDLGGLGPWTGNSLPMAGPIALAATLKGDAGNAEIGDFALKIGRTELAGNAAIDLRGTRPQLTAELSANEIDITELLPDDSPTTENGSPDQSAPAAASKTSDGDKLFSAEPLPLEFLKLFDAKVAFDVAKLVLDGAILADTKGQLALDNGALAIKPLSTSLANSVITGDIGVDTRNDPATVSLELDASRLDVGENLRTFAGLENLRGRGAADISVRGAGSSVAEIMASLNGHTRLLMDEGEMRNQFLANVSGLTQTLGEAFGKQEWVAIECIASDFEIIDGIANSRINVINTQPLLIVAEGTVDLAEEKLKLKISPRPKGIELSLAVPVNIRGTLANPTFAPDTVGTGKKVGGVLGAIVFPPAAVIGLADLGSSDNPCLQTADASGASQEQENESRSTVESATDAAKDAIDSVGRGLKKLFGN